MKEKRYVNDVIAKRIILVHLRIIFQILNKKNERRKSFTITYYVNDLYVIIAHKKLIRYCNLFVILLLKCLYSKTI